jgi:hypothetical protein
LSKKDFLHNIYLYRKFFNKLHIVTSLKYGANKASFSEFGIFLVKKRLFQCLRAKLSDDWPHFLPFVVTALNERKLKKLGYLAPIDIKSSLDNVKVQEALQSKNIEPFSQPDWRTQEKNQQKYEKSKAELQVGKYVYRDDPARVFSKSFHTQVVLRFFVCFPYVVKSQSLLLFVCSHVAYFSFFS